MTDERRQRILEVAAELEAEGQPATNSFSLFCVP